MIPDTRATLSGSGTCGRLARIGAFELDVAAGELRRSGRPVALTGQPLRVLITLVERAGTIVTRDEMRRAIWGETHVDFEAGLSTCINQIRTALGDRAAAPRFVETLPRRGYRFVAPVQWLDPRSEQEPPAVIASGEATDRPRTGVRATSRRRFVAVAVAMACVATVAIWSARIMGERARFQMMVLPVIVDPAMSDLDPVSRSLTDALIGALATEAGDRARLVSPLATQQFMATSWQRINQAGIEYVVMVTLRSLGGPVLVHVKLIGRDGLVTWASDREMTVEELQRAPLRLADELAKSLMQQIASRRAG